MQYCRARAVSALFSDFLSWLSGRTCERLGHDPGGGQQPDGAAAHAPHDPEAQAAAVAELKQDCAKEKGRARAVRFCLWARAAIAARVRAPQTNCSTAVQDARTGTQPVMMKRHAGLNSASLFVDGLLKHKPALGMLGLDLILLTKRLRSGDAERLRVQAAERGRGEARAVSLQPRERRRLPRGVYHSALAAPSCVPSSDLIA